MVAVAMPVRPRFDERYVPEPNTGCWLWTHTIFKTGYGSISVNGRPTKAHRVSWMLHHGEDPGRMHVLHKCDVPLCVNPDHLFLGTHAENMADMARKGRAAGAYGEQRNAKITEEDVRAILRDDRSAIVVAKQYGIDRVSVWNIRLRRTWAHVECSDALPWKSHKKVNPSEIPAFRRMYVDERLPLQRISEATGRSMMTIRHALRSVGVEMRGHSGRDRLTP